MWYTGGKGRPETIHGTDRMRGKGEKKKGIRLGEARVVKGGEGVWREANGEDSSATKHSTGSTKNG